MEYNNKYHKYKQKYLSIKMNSLHPNNQFGGHDNIILHIGKNTYTFNFSDNTIIHNIDDELSKKILVTNLSSFRDNLISNKSFTINEILEPSKYDTNIYFYKSKINNATFSGSFTLRISFENTIIKAVVLSLINGKMIRNDTSTSFGCVFNGYFNGLRFVNGILSIKYQHISFESTKFIPIFDKSNVLYDYHIYDPIIKTDTLMDIDTNDIQNICKFTSVGNDLLLSMRKVLFYLLYGEIKNHMETYKNVYTKCIEHVGNKLQIDDTFIKNELSSSICKLFYFSVDPLDVKDKSIVDVRKFVEDNISNDAHIDFNKLSNHVKTTTTLSNTPLIGYDKFPNTMKTSNSYLDAFYQMVFYQLNIDMHGGEIEILVPFDISLKTSNIFYKWIPITNNEKMYIIDTGNDSISLMSLKFFNTFYLGHITDDTKRRLIYDSIVDTTTEALNICGIGGVSCDKHIGYITIVFRICDAHRKGFFEIDCDIRDGYNGNLLIGDKNKPNIHSHLYNVSNMNKILKEKFISLKKS